MCDRTEAIDLKGRPVEIDACIAPLIRALNEGGIDTLACCCGHGTLDGRVLLASGGELRVVPPARVGHVGTLLGAREAAAFKQLRG